MNKHRNDSLISTGLSHVQTTDTRERSCEIQTCPNVHAKHTRRSITPKTPDAMTPEDKVLIHFLEQIAGFYEY